MTDPTPRMLTVDLLTQLELRWEKLGLVGVLDYLRPGLTDAEMDAFTEPLGLVLPEEARVWWGWHDGTDPTSSTRSREGSSRCSRRAGSFFPSATR